MGDIAEQYSDILVITDDNPRNEDSNDIINGICKGIKDKSKIYLVPNRKKAIDRAISLSQKKDISEPETINEFIKHVEQDEKLDYLYLLTINDIRATNPALWNGWKHQLLKDLYILSICGFNLE